VDNGQRRGRLQKRLVTAYLGFDRPVEQVYTRLPLRGGTGGPTTLLSVQKVEACSTLKRVLAKNAKWGLDKESFFWYNKLRFGNLNPYANI
jgi:hypothetical protein